MNAPLGWSSRVVVALFAVLVSGAFASAADDEPASIKGQVLLDGQPLPNGKIRFHADGGKSYEAKVNEGTYSIDSVPPGEYRLTIKSEVVPRRYATPETTGVVAETKAGRNVLDINVKSNGARLEAAPPPAVQPAKACPAKKCCGRPCHRRLRCRG